MRALIYYYNILKSLILFKILFRKTRNTRPKNGCLFLKSTKNGLFFFEVQKMGETNCEVQKMDETFFEVQKKIGGNLSKIQTLAFEESVIDVLSKKVKIILVRQVEPNIRHLEQGLRKRLVKDVESHFPKTK